jgi:L-fuculose-phosphate aldolase
MNKKHILEIARRLHQKNMLAAADGNISFRVNDNEIWITPSGVSKAFITESDLACINLQGEILQGQPSGERLMHLQIFKSCAKAKAIVHAHPVTAIAWSVAKPELEELPADGLSEVILACGRIPFVPYARPGTSQMGEVLQSFLPEYRALILRRHGAVTWGESLEEAYRGMERIEHSAQILMSAQMLGGLSSLPSEELSYLRELRKKLGPQLL